MLDPEAWLVHSGWLITFAAAAAVWIAAASATTPVKVYKDVVGDAERGHGDIAGAVVSDRGGRVTVKMNIRGLRASDTGILELGKEPVPASEYVLFFSRSGAWELDSVTPPGHTMRDVSQTPGTAFSRVGNTYVFRFGSRVLRGPILRRARRFFFELHIDTSAMADVSDWAPDGDYESPHGWWTYTLTSAH